MQKKLIPFVVMSAYILASCNFPGTEVKTEESARNAVLTAAAETVAVALDQGTVFAETATVVPTNLASIDPTKLPASTATFLASITDTPIPSNTSIPSNTPLPCNMATCVKDVTVPDDTIFGPGANFTKTWRLNSSTIEPGQSLDVSVDLQAPSAEGTYRGNWRLRDAGGDVFGLTSGGTFWVQIKVVALKTQL
jgi:hypothetical protein